MLNISTIKIAYMKKAIDTIGDRIRQTRESLKMTQEQLGKAAGISASAISQIETGASKSTHVENIFPIARALRKNPEWLITGKGPEAPLMDIVDAITELPDDNPQQVLDFLSYRWERAENFIASDKVARYMAMISNFKDDLDRRRKKGG